MCGICGAIGFDPTEAGEAVVRRMLAALVHRGPDDEGILSASPRIRSACAASALLTFPAAASPSGTKPAPSPFSTTARSTISGTARRTRILRPFLSHEIRYRSSRPRLRAWGEECAPKPSRHVCVRHRRNAGRCYGSRDEAISCARSSWASSRSTTLPQTARSSSRRRCALCLPAAGSRRRFPHKRFRHICCSAPSVSLRR